MWRRSPELTALAVLAAGVLAGAALARAEEPPPASGGALRIVAEPARPVLNPDVVVDLRVSAPSDVEEVSFSASAGKVEGVRRLPGGFAARYRPPADHVPRVAIVAAVGRSARGVEDGWLAIPMSGRGTARVRGDPGTPVSLRIGDRTFGPETAGRDGVAAIPVVVPPGIREGHQGYRPIDLHVPETSLLHAVAEREAVQADREEKVRVVVYVVAPHGAARRGEAPLFEPSRGTIAFSEREAGAWVASWTLPPGPAGDDRLVVRVPAAPASRAVVHVLSTPGPAAVVAVSVDRPELVAGGEGASVLARALDAAGNPVPASLALQVRGGVLEAVEERRPGVVAARLSAGTTLQGAEAVVTATAPALGIAGSRAVPLRPGAPAAARFGRRAVVLGDGRRETVLQVEVADRYGNPVEVTPVVTSERGRIVEIAAAGRGSFDVRYVAPAVERPETDALVARVGELRATLDPVVAPPAPRLRLAASAGGALELRGRFSGATALLTADRPLELDDALKVGIEPALHLEAGALPRAGDGATGMILAGLAGRRAGGAVVAGASASAGAVFHDGHAAPAVRLAASLGLGGDGAEPFLEISALAARSGAPGSYVAAGLALGVRLGEGSRDHDPDRR